MICENGNGLFRKAIKRLNITGTDGRPKAGGGGGERVGEMYSCDADHADTFNQGCDIRPLTE